jgi:DNA replication licensing factor MCM6
MPRSIDVIMRGDIVDKAKPGDKAIFTGTLVVVPDIVQLMKPGERVQSSKMDFSKMQRSEAKPMDGVGGLKETGIRDLSYKLVFIASAVHTSDSRFGFQSNNQEQGEEEDLPDLEVN